MRISRKVLANILVGFLAAPATPAFAAKYVVNWYIGHPNLDYFEEAAANFKKAVEARSGGEIEVRIAAAYAGDTVAPPKPEDIAAKVQKGEVEMGHSFTDGMGAVDGRLLAFNAPYLLRDYRHMEGVVEGPVGANLLSGLHKDNLLGLCFTYSGGASGVATVDREIRRPEDLKGLKIGVYGDPVSEAWLKSLGAVPVNIGHDLTRIGFMAQSHELDGVVITWRNFQVQALNQGFKYFNLPGSTYLVSMTYVNEKFFNSLPASYRTLIKEESVKAARVERAKTIQLNEDAKREMLGKGVWPIYLTAEGRRDFAQALRPSYEHSLNPLIGEKLIREIRKTPDADENPSVDSHTLAAY